MCGQYNSTTMCISLRSTSLDTAFSRGSHCFVEFRYFPLERPGTIPSEVTRSRTREVINQDDRLKDALLAFWRILPKDLHVLLSRSLNNDSTRSLLNSWLCRICSWLRFLLDRLKLSIRAHRSNLQRAFRAPILRNSGLNAAFPTIHGGKPALSETGAQQPRPHMIPRTQINKVINFSVFETKTSFSAMKPKAVCRSVGIPNCRSHNAKLQ